MSAEDYLDDRDPWYDDDDSDYYSGPAGFFRQRRVVTCKRCGTPNLVWGKHEGGWKLFGRNTGILHICKHPFHSILAPASPSALMQPTTKAVSLPPERSPLMDKNAVAFIRNDVKSVVVVFPPDSREISSSEDVMTAVEITDACRGSKRYTYLTTDPSLAAGDWAFVFVKGVPRVVFILQVHEVLSITPGENIEYKYIGGKIDIGPYSRLLEQNNAIFSVLREGYQTTPREGFRNTLINGLDQDKQSQISLLLSK